jgi:hypothetical protein
MQAIGHVCRIEILPGTRGRWRPLGFTFLYGSIEPPHIGSGAKGRVGTGQHKNAEFRVLRESVNFPFELLAQLTAERVARCRVV